MSSQLVAALLRLLRADLRLESCGLFFATFEPEELLKVVAVSAGVDNGVFLPLEDEDDDPRFAPGYSGNCASIAGEDSGENDGLVLAPPLMPEACERKNGVWEGCWGATTGDMTGENTMSGRT